MLDCMNNWWIILICGILFFVIIKKIYNLTQPFDEYHFLLQCKNQEKLKQKLNLNDVPSMVPSLTSFYLGLN